MWSRSEALHRADERTEDEVIAQYAGRRAAPIVPRGRPAVSTWTRAAAHLGRVLGEVRSHPARSAADGVRWFLSPPATTRGEALDRMERTVAVTHLVSSLERLLSSAEWRRGGMNNWEITREGTMVTSKVGRRVLDVVSRQDVTAAIHCVRIGSALALLGPTRSRRVRVGAGLTLSTTALLLHPRHHYGTDGSDQVSFLVQTLAAVSRAAGARHRIVDAALWAVGIQAALSYTVSGWAKLAGKTWRSGEALAGVTRTMTYGHPGVWRLTRRFPRAARVAGAGVLVFESTFPAAYLAGGRLARPYIAGATVLHCSIAGVMALGRFVPAFTAMHPALLYTARPARSITGPARDDTVAHVAGATALGLLVAAAVVRRTNERRVHAGRGDEQWLTTSDGNRIAYRRWGSDDPADPVYVFESGLLSTPEHWEWMAEALAGSATVVTYQRAGYGASSARPGTALTLDDLVEHASQLVATVGAGRSIVLVGHSLGGYLAVRTAARHPGVSAVVLVDSSHPDELRRSARQASGAEGLSDSFPMTVRSLELGLGGLLEVPDWVRSLPESSRRTALAQYRDPGMWRAARREWAATVRGFEAEPSLPRLGMPVLAVSAGATLLQDPVTGEMHAELAALGPDGRHEVIEGADHDSILSAALYARTVARFVAEFVAAARSKAGGAAA